MKGLRKRLIWLGAAVGIVLTGWAIVALPGASTGQFQGGEKVIDVTSQEAAAATPVPQDKDARSKQQTGRPTPRAGQNGLATRPEPIVILNSGIVTHNSEIVARGFGFEPYEDVLITLYNPGGDQEAQIGLIQADKEGNFSDARFYVANTLAPGEHTVVATGQKSGITGQAPFRIQASGPWLALDSYAEKPGSRYTFKAGGFDPREEVALYFDTVQSESIGTLRADEIGALAQASATVPALSPGEHAFILVGQQSKTVVSSPFTVLGFYPWVGLTSYSPQPEQSIGFIGHDFAPGERVSFFLGSLSSPILGNVTADQYGNFETQNSFEIPVNAVGEIVLVFIGSSSQMPVEVTVNVLPFGPLLELSTYAGPPGTRVSFNGQGFAREEVIHVYMGKAGEHEVSAFAADRNGAFSGAGEFAIPFDIGSGKIALTAVGEMSNTPISMVFAVLELVPWVGLSQYDAPVGTVITFTGNGFGLGEPVNVYYGNNRSEPIATAVADGTGAFAEAGPYVIPEDAKGKIDFTFVGQQSKATATATFTVAEAVPVPEGEPAPPADEAPG